MAGGLLLAAAGLTIAALLPGLAGLLAGGTVIGVGTGVATRLGLAALAAHAASQRPGQTRGPRRSAANSPTPADYLPVAAIATTAILSGGLISLAVVLAAAGATISRAGPRARAAARSHCRRVQ